MNLSARESHDLVKFLINPNATELGTGGDALAAAILRIKIGEDFDLFAENILEAAGDAVEIYKEYLEGMSIADATALVLILLGQIGRNSSGRDFAKDMLGPNNFDLNKSREEFNKVKEQKKNPGGPLIIFMGEFP